MIAIIDYGSGNVHAIKNQLDDINLANSITSKIEEIDNADKLILAGVGHFDFTMKRLKEMNLIDALERNVIEKKKPIIGICVGMQIMGDSSEEGNEPGLGWISGQVKKMEIDRSLKPNLPHMGWNSISSKHKHPLLRGIDMNLGFYFLHSFHFECSNPDNELASFEYNKCFTGAIHKDNIFGVQFHPEKSHINGQKIFINFANL